MFTGIIEEIGKVIDIRRGPASAQIRIAAENILSDVSDGDSIAVNGICLTVTSHGPHHFTADIMHETLNRSSAGGLRNGGSVNLERAMRADARFGGHIVTGHIDGTGTIRSVTRDDTAVWYTILAAPDILRLIVEKGSVAVDGISLTVAAVSAEDFSVSVIPHTAANTTLAGKRAGDTVNLENDCIGKYVARLLGATAPSCAGTPPRAADTARKASHARPSHVTRKLPRENGFC